MNKILEGIRVLDFGRYVAGPYCATLLGYLGADVIRIERPGGGEDRFIAPLGEGDAGSVMMQTGCNKRSLTLNFREPDSRDILDRLLASADVVVANLPPAALERLGLDYARLRRIDPGLVLVSLTAFGTDGPYAERGGFDGIGQAMSGAMYMTGMPGKPAKAAAPYVDYSTAVLAAFGALAALLERERSGEGQEVKGSLLGTALAVFNSHLIEEGGLGIGREPTGNRVQTSGPSDVFETLDGHVLLHVVGNGLFRRLAGVIGATEWLEDSSLATDSQRGDARDRLAERVGEWTGRRTTAEVLDVMAGAGVPAGPVLNLAEAIRHPQVEALGALKAVNVPDTERGVPVADLPVTLSRTPAGIDSPPPTAGQHTDAILGQLGFTADEISRFRQNGVV
jgi:crotonobetainyl-CoA:carnitine CoA-transferase CaiB-like acyl-CoA transferase